MSGNLACCAHDLARRPRPNMTERERLLVNEERTVLVRIWPDGPVEVATRPGETATWGPPVLVFDEDTGGPTASEIADLRRALATEAERADRLVVERDRYRTALEEIAEYDGSDWDDEGVCGHAVDVLAAGSQGQGVAEQEDGAE